MAKLHTKYAAIVMLLVGVKIQCAHSTNATLFSPLINNSSSINATLLVYDDTHQNGTKSKEQNTLGDAMSPTTSNPNHTEITTTASTTTTEITTTASTTTTKDPQLLLIPPAEVNASIAQMHNVPRKKGQIIIR